MKMVKPNSYGGDAGRKLPADVRIPRIPMEWLGAGQWCLPSGKALAEFALQAGFLAPLMLGTGSVPKKRQAKPLPVDATLNNAAPVTVGSVVRPVREGQ